MDELAKQLAAWLRQQPGITEVEILDVTRPPFGADPAIMLGKAFIGFRQDGVGVSLAMEFTE